MNQELVRDNTNSWVTLHTFRPPCWCLPNNWEQAMRGFSSPICNLQSMAEMREHLIFFNGEIDKSDMPPHDKWRCLWRIQAPVKNRYMHFFAGGMVGSSTDAGVSIVDHPPPVQVSISGSALLPTQELCLSHRQVQCLRSWAVWWMKPDGKAERLDPHQVCFIYDWGGLDVERQENSSPSAFLMIDSRWQ